MYTSIFNEYLKKRLNFDLRVFVAGLVLSNGVVLPCDCVTCASSGLFGLALLLSYHTLMLLLVFFLNRLGGYPRPKGNPVHGWVTFCPICQGPTCLYCCLWGAGALQTVFVGSDHPCNHIYALQILQVIISAEHFHLTQYLKALWELQPSWSWFLSCSWVPCPRPTVWGPWVLGTSPGLLSEPWSVSHSCPSWALPFFLTLAHLKLPSLLPVLPGDCSSVSSSHSFGAPALALPASSHFYIVLPGSGSGPPKLQPACLLSCPGRGQNLLCSCALGPSETCAPCPLVELKLCVPLKAPIMGTLQPPLLVTSCPPFKIRT